MTDKKKPDTPDSVGQFDEFDVPTYDPSKRSKYASDAPTSAVDEPVARKESVRKDSVREEKKPARRGLFDRSGRAEPQFIEPKSAADVSAETQAQTTAETTAETTAFPASNSKAAADYDEPKFAETSEDYARADRLQQSRAEETKVVEREPAGASAGVGAGVGAGAAAAAVPVAAAGTDTSLLDEPAETEEERAKREERERLAEEKREGYRTYGKRGTIDFGLLLVRIALAAYLIIAGVTTFFTLGGSEGIAGLEADFANYALPNVLAIAVPTLQLIAGAFLLLGLVTPLAAMLGLVVTGFMAIHELAQAGAGLDVFAWPDAMWLSIVLFVIAVALQFTGPGFYSLDFGRSWARRPLVTSWIFVILGIAALVAAWWFGAAVNPLA